MELLDKSDQEIKEIAQPIWDNLVKCSNIKDYGGFTKDFSSQMLYGANEVELGKQWANNKLIKSFGTTETGGMHIKIKNGVIKKPPPTPNKPERIPTIKLTNNNKKISIFT